VDSTSAGDALSFDKATYQNAAAGTPCARCRSELGGQYFHWLGTEVCEGCAKTLERTLLESQSKQAFGRATLLGGLTAMGCGVAYAAFVAATDYQLALVTIGIAFLVAKVLRRCSLGVGGRKYQLLAVALTYGASAMGYAPGVYSALRGDDGAEVAEGARAESGQASEDTQGEPSGAPGSVPDASPLEPSRAASAPASIGMLAVGLALFLAITLAAPFLAAFDAPMGLLIVAFGLWEAWRLTHGAPLSLDGPYRIEAASTKVAEEPAPPVS